MRDAGPPETAPSYFDRATGGEMSPAQGAAAAVSALAGALGGDPRWVIETAGGRVAALAIEAFGDGEALVASLDVEGSRVALTFEAHGSGWVEVRGTVEGAEVFCAYLDRPYEDYDLWPPGAAVSVPRDAEAPGRIGKRGTWISLAAEAWPQLAPFADRFGVVGASEEDSLLRDAGISLE